MFFLRHKWFRNERQEGRVSADISRSSGAKAGMHLFGRAALPGKLQRKAVVSQPGDPLEREADQVADAVMSGAPAAAPANAGAATGHIQRKCACGGSAAGECEECRKREEEEGMVQRKAAESGGLDRPGGLSHGSASTLDPGTRAFMEQRFGENFGDVEVHADSAADRSARAYQALAYTSGSHIVFRSGQYEPQTDSGRKLIAHELAHVVQQRNGPPAISRSPDDAAPKPVSHTAEIEALLDAKDPVAGVGSPAQAAVALRDLPDDELIATMRELRDRGRMEQLRPGIAYQGTRLWVAFRAVELEGQGASAAPEDWARAREGCLQLDPSDRSAFIAAIPHLQTPAEPAIPASASSLPGPLLATLGRSFARRMAGMRGSTQNLDNAFWGGRPANFDAALAAMGTAGMAIIREIYDRWTAAGLSWPLLDNLLNVWSGGAPGFNFTTASTAALQAALEASPQFCQDIALVGGAYHFVHGETPCWREVVSGAHGLHFCLGAATPSVHIDPTQIVSSKLLGTCVYDPSVTYQHWKDLGWVP
ncbi:MAG: DUF4157 domain-containing protein [Bryobacteraceae bacterium]